jgi:hypothetical protein
MDEAGILPERDIQEEPSDEAESPAPIETGQIPGPAPADEKRLDVFEDFLKKLGGESDEEKPKP